MEHWPTSATATRSELDWGLAPSRPRPGAPLAGDLRVRWVPGSPQPGCEAPGASARGGFRPVPGHSRPVASGLLLGAAGPIRTRTSNRSGTPPAEGGLRTLLLLA